jgi:acetylornithine deacetylase/succinyl-diaminopimelate desuccinylase-like protein
VRADNAPAEDARVAAYMLDAKLAIAERLGAAIRLQTISWERDETVAGAHSTCGNPFHSHRSADGDTADRAPALPSEDAALASAVASSNAALLQLHELLQRSYPCMHATLERHVVGKYSLLFVWRGSDPSLQATGLYAHLDVVPAGEAHLWSFPPFCGDVRDGCV